MGPNPWDGSCDVGFCLLVRSPHVQERKRMAPVIGSVSVTFSSLDAPFATAKRYHRKDQRVDLMRSGRMRGTGAESRPEM
jgi:hypothetical protein